MTDRNQLRHDFDDRVRIQMLEIDADRFESVLQTELSEVKQELSEVRAGQRRVIQAVVSLAAGLFIAMATALITFLASGAGA